MLLKINVRNGKEEAAKNMRDSTFISSGILLLNYQEWEYTSISREYPTFEDLVDYANDKDIPFYIVNGATADSPLLFDASNERYKNIQPIISWPTYFLTTWFDAITNNPDQRKDVYDLVNSKFNQEFKYLYVSLNNKPHWHRCLQMDLLVKYNLLNRGAVSWNSWQGYQGRNLDESLLFQWKHWTPQLLILDEVEKNDLGWGTKLPNEYNFSFVQLISESTVNATFITEKIVLALLYNKLFIVSGPVNYYKALKDLGFELYDEIFDYSFDSESNTEKRLEMVTENIIRYRDYSPEDLRSLYDKVFTKIQYNKKHMIKVATDISHFPKILVDLCEADSDIILRDDVWHFYHKYKLGPIILE